MMILATTRKPSKRARVLSILAAAVLVGTGVLAVAPAAQAADPVPPTPAPLLQRDTDVATADALPTVQIDDGYVWAQTTIGTTVYAAGSFKNARAALAAPGTSLTPRTNILAYDITTGNLKPFAPQVNGVIKSIAASPDGRRIYIGGSFSQVNGATRYNFAALDASSGALIAGFAPSVGGSGVYGIVATGDTVYVGGRFTQGNGVARANLAAFSTSNGALLSWTPSTDLQVDAMVMEPGNQKVIIAGRFYAVNGVGGEQRGIAALDPATGQTVPWAVTSIIKNGWAEGGNAGKSGIFTLATDAGGVYGTGWTFADVATGNIEGTFAVNAGAGDLRWLADCHGDHYGVWSTGKVVYSTSHTHQCDTVGLWPEQPTRQYRYLEAYTADARGTLPRTPSESSIYKNWAGTPSPSAYAWYPDFTVGNTSGLGQAGLSITGSGDFISVAGEFGSVNNGRYQGIVRFSTKPSSGAKQGPRVATAAWTPSARSIAAGEARVQILANWDRDDLNLTYELRRSGRATPVATTSVASTWWQRPGIVLKDTDVTAGQTYTYTVVAKDANGNTVQSSPASVTIASESASAYATAVIEDSAAHYWPLGEDSGSAGFDWAGSDDLTVKGATRGAPGQNRAASTTATEFSGTDQSFASTVTSEAGPNTFSVEAWFKTTSTSGGKIIGFGDNAGGTSGSYDRHVYLSNDGRVTFGVYPNSVQTLESGTGFNDGAWHHVVGTLSSSGMTLYLDGALVGGRTDVTSAQGYNGYWKVGGDNTGGWPNGGSSNYLAGAISDVAVYPSALSVDAVNRHYLASGRGTAPAAAPTDAYGAAVYALKPSVYWRLDEASGDAAADASGAGYSYPGTYFGGVTKAAPSALATGAGTSIQLSPNGQTGVTGNKQVFNPSTYSMETWFKTTSRDGGKLIGFGSNRTGESGSYDRHVYMNGDGVIKFGVWNGWAGIIESAPGFNDGSWHHVVASQSAAGMRLYLDGQLVAQNDITTAQNYSGYWRIGGDNGWEGATYWTGSLDEAAVYPTALTAAQVTDHFRIGSGQQPPNGQPKDAALTAEAAGLTVAFAGTATDPDGDPLTYQWNFGDDASDTGATVSHRFAAAGTYRVTLTVTDGRGGSTQRAEDVTVTHAAPVAKFTSTTDELAVATDASASAASDDATLTYDWNWGDGSAHSTGATASHVYDKDGDYTITLTLTDSLGGTSTAERSVSVAKIPAPAFVAADAFGRTTSSGWGTSDVGGAWSILSGSASVASVQDGRGQLTLPAGQTRNLALTSTVRDSESRVDYTLVNAPSSGAGYVGLGARRIGANFYTVRVWHRDTGAVWLVAQRGTTVLTSKQVSGLTWGAGDSFSLRLDVTGANPTAIRAKVWKHGATEPAAWQLETTDSTAGMQEAGAPLLHYAMAGTATAPGTVKFDNLTVRDTQVAPAPNQAPVAAFSSSVASLTASVDASASSDTDGSIASYSWNWGDGSPSSTGKTASHVYESAGDHVITLTVVDDDGASHTVTKSVTTTAPAPNQDPVASFTSSASDLTLSVDGSGSSDADGSIASYSWKWGDSSENGAGAKTSHSFSAAGTYEVTLTVTDDDGATHSAKKTVTVTAPAPTDVLARDAFERTAANGWGASDLGGTWTISDGAVSAASVGNGVGRFALNAGSTRTALLAQTPVRNFTASADFTVDVSSTSGSGYAGIVPRRSGSNFYAMSAWLRSDGKVWLVAQRGSTVLQTTTATGLTYKAGDSFSLKVESSGAPGTTELRAKLWQKGATEPTAWQLVASDTDAALQAAAPAGLRASRASSSTSAMTVSFDEFRIAPIN
ncbi:PKD domain-containing protein [Microbacterium sp. KSW-18]|uniref:PKD domain-containing protein n=1 Tax=Microbacterium aquilitoris TaxID=3067307 RepID=A0ABU3GG03_9MICO|nr:PKD domain-containing protein [Microbacterium sp. KSW-18]MDT3329634.1 PKD domain-containing protein [Microbacterium sp. KSW-18]